MAMEFAMALWGIYTFIMGINEKKRMINWFESQAQRILGQ